MLMNKPRILIIEDDEDILNFIMVELKYENYDVYSETEGIKGLSLFRKINPDLVILDRLLPNIDGLELCRRIRQTADTPVLMLTALGETKDKVTGLDAGANDYLVKPFSLEELLARIRVQLRIKNQEEKIKLNFADLIMDISTREVKRDGQEINLSPKEFEILKLLLQSQPRVVTKEDLIEKIWGWDFEGDNSVLDVCLHGLRNKIENNFPQKIIHNVRGIGYTLKAINAN